MPFRRTRGSESELFPGRMMVAGDGNILKISSRKTISDDKVKLYRMTGENSGRWTGEIPISFLNKLNVVSLDKQDAIEAFLPTVTPFMEGFEESDEKVTFFWVDTAYDSAIDLVDESFPESILTTELEIGTMREGVDKIFTAIGLVEDGIDTADALFDVGVVSRIAHVFLLKVGSDMNNQLIRIAENILSENASKESLVLQVRKFMQHAPLWGAQKSRAQIWYTRDTISTFVAKDVHIENALSHIDDYKEMVRNADLSGHPELVSQNEALFQVSDNLKKNIGILNERLLPMQAVADEEEDVTDSDIQMGLSGLQFIFSENADRIRLLRAAAQTGDFSEVFRDSRDKRVLLEEDPPVFLDDLSSAPPPKSSRPASMPEFARFRKSAMARIRTITNQIFASRSKTVKQEHRSEMKKAAKDLLKIHSTLTARSQRAIRAKRKRKSGQRPEDQYSDLSAKLEEAMGPARAARDWDNIRNLEKQLASNHIHLDANLRELRRKVDSAVSEMKDLPEFGDVVAAKEKIYDVFEFMEKPGFSEILGGSRKELAESVANLSDALKLDPIQRGEMYRFLNASTRDTTQSQVQGEAQALSYLPGKIRSLRKEASDLMAVGGAAGRRKAKKLEDQAKRLEKLKEGIEVSQRLGSTEIDQRIAREEQRAREAEIERKRKEGLDLSDVISNVESESVGLIEAMKTRLTEAGNLIKKAEVDPLFREAKLIETEKAKARTRLLDSLKRDTEAIKKEQAALEALIKEEPRVTDANLIERSRRIRDIHITMARHGLKMTEVNFVRFREGTWLIRLRELTPKILHWTFFPGFKAADAILPAKTHKLLSFGTWIVLGGINLIIVGGIALAVLRFPGSDTLRAAKDATTKALESLAGGKKKEDKDEGFDILTFLAIGFGISLIVAPKTVIPAVGSVFKSVSDIFKSIFAAKPARKGKAPGRDGRGRPPQITKLVEQWEEAKEGTKKKKDLQEKLRKLRKQGWPVPPEI